jgi:hypothetical protein
MNRKTLTPRFVADFGACCISLALAAPASAKTDQQLWTTGNLNVKLSDEWRFSQELTGRFSDNRNGLYELEAVSMIGYRIGKNVTLAAGYVHNPQYSNGEYIVTEHRAREQVSFDNVAQLGPGKLSLRFRMEQRWRDHFDGTGWRARPYVKYSIPLVGKTSLVLSNETFLNFNTTAFQRQSGLDRMRNLIAINTPLTKAITLEAGYLNQHGFVRHGEDTSDHVASITLNFNL